MINNVPTSHEFMRASIGVLNQAWDGVSELSTEVRRSMYGDWDAEQITEYWQTAQPRLRTALTLVQQAAEIGVKGRIAAIDPFLLIANDPDRWPKYQPNGVDFSEFYTLSANDLLNVHDLFSATPFTKELRDHYERMRRLRNENLHGVSFSRQLTDSGLFVDILILFRNLYPDKHWSTERLKYQSTGPLAALHSSDHALSFVLRELDLLVEILSPSVLKKELGFDKKNGRRYICPRCYAEAGSRDEFANEFVSLAKLQPNSPASQQVYCLACNQSSKVRRAKCGRHLCGADVLDDQDSICLTCEFRNDG